MPTTETEIAERNKRLQRAMDKINGAQAGELAGLRGPVLAKLAGYSLFHFHRIFAEHFAVTPKRAVARRQVVVAKELMLQGRALAQVAKLCGFAHQSHFCSVFRSHVGQTPTQWLTTERAKAA